MEDVQHVLDNVHFLYLFALNVQHLLPGVVVIAYLHIPLFLEASSYQVKSVLDYYFLDVLVDWADLLLCLGAHIGLVLSVEGRVIVGLEEPRVEVLIDEDIHPYDMEALTVHFRESGAIVVLKEGIYASEKALGQLLNPTPQQSYIHSILYQLLPHHLQAPLSALTKRVLAIHKIRVIFVETVVSKMDERIIKVLLAGFLVILSAKPGQSFFVEVADVGIK